MTYKLQPVGDLYFKIEVFDWTSEDTRTTIRFSVSEMLTQIARRALPCREITTPIDANWATTWLPKRDPKIEYAMGLSPERAAEPVLGVWMPDETVLLIDGTHRYMNRFMWGHDTIDWLVVTDPDWRAYAIITGPIAPPVRCPFP